MRYVDTMRYRHAVRAAALAALALAGACASEAPVRVLGEESRPGEIGLSQYSLELGAMVGYSPFTGVPNLVAVTSPQGGTLRGLTAISDRDWIVATLHSTTTPADLVILVKTSGLAAGFHTGTVTVNATNAVTPKSINVSVMASPPPVIVLSPTGIAFSAATGGSLPAVKGVSISTVGPGFPGNFIVSGAPAWLSATMSPSSQIVSLQPTTTATSGQFSATLTISSTIPVIAPVALPVTYTVSDAP